MCLFVLTLLRQYCTGKNQLQCCPRGSRQFSPSENPAQFFLITLGTLFNSSKPYTLLPKRLQTKFHQKKPRVNVVLILLGRNPVQCCLNTPRTTLHRKNSVQCCLKCSRQHCIKKILFNVALILFGRHYIGEDPTECSLRGFRKYCMRKNPVQCCLNNLKTSFTGQSRPRVSREHYIKENLVYRGLNTLGSTFHK